MGLEQDQEKKLLPKESLQEAALDLPTIAQSYGTKFHKRLGPVNQTVVLKKK